MGIPVGSAAVDWFVHPVIIRPLRLFVICKARLTVSRGCYVLPGRTMTRIADEMVYIGVNLHKLLRDD